MVTLKVYLHVSNVSVFSLLAHRLITHCSSRVSVQRERKIEERWQQSLQVDAELVVVVVELNKAKQQQQWRSERYFQSNEAAAAALVEQNESWKHVLDTWSREWYIGQAQRCQVDSLDYFYGSGMSVNVDRRVWRRL